MGIQIYIKKSAINVLATEKELVHAGCHCGCVTEESEFCDECKSYAESWYDTYCTVEGLDILMHDFGDTVYHDANAWGSSRAPILAFIESNNISDNDWYDA